MDCKVPLPPTLPISEDTHFCNINLQVFFFQYEIVSFSHPLRFAGPVTYNDPQSMKTLIMW